MSINDWLRMARRMRVLSTFPRLSSLEATAGLQPTGKEDGERGWVKNSAIRLYELQATDSLYEQRVEGICAPHHGTKFDTIHGLIKDWAVNEIAVFCTMSPTNALILYWVGFHSMIMQHDC